MQVWPRNAALTLLLIALALLAVFQWLPALLLFPAAGACWFGTRRRPRASGVANTEFLAPFRRRNAAIARKVSPAYA
ncbi:hypothetical protein [Arthrobacter sp. JCM 19049]|uniref:hypothetical protein n=1 Tax=Arthrobacter sp. JCM 19049 TaxID=1460643 RepID=UPI0006D23AE7|nr:hypothetical protein [Arthrobacter sp. JCM 19049]